MPDTFCARDERWAGEARSAVLYAAVLFALLLGIDALTGQLAPWRVVSWAGLGAALGLVLLPARVGATADRLTARGLWRERSVRTDRLVAVRCVDGVAHRLVLRDDLGGRVEIDPAVLVANPPLWRLLDEAARVSVERGLLLCGGTALRRLARQVDGELARTVFQVSGLR
ncbi:hypothetical protein [Streptomyces longispororuber]|uniref:hypothetical protein n=1 Tax=Streptomyces longispororuber TaxID=68230 RepID=UPI00210A2114|nr:hypothetical protein [Streptomyces longispororuber]MCQ4207799.1 hypothetical protein [Streptomyces longispororuber]